MIKTEGFNGSVVLSQLWHTAQNYAEDKEENARTPSRLCTYAYCSVLRFIVRTPYPQKCTSNETSSITLTQDFTMTNYNTLPVTEEATESLTQQGRRNYGRIAVELA